MKTGKLVLSRKEGQRIFLGDKICVEIVRITGNVVKVAIQAPDGVKIMREEIMVGAGPGEAARDC